MVVYCPVHPVAQGSDLHKVRPVYDHMTPWSQHNPHHHHHVACPLMNDALIPVLYKGSKSFPHPRPYPGYQDWPCDPSMQASWNWVDLSSEPVYVCPAFSFANSACLSFPNVERFQMCAKYTCVLRACHTCWRILVMRCTTPEQGGAVTSLFSFCETCNTQHNETNLYHYKNWLLSLHIFVAYNPKLL